MNVDQISLTVAEIAEKLKIKTDSVRRLFSNEPGVIVVCCPAPGKRAYRTLRIPRRVLLRVLTRLTIQYRWRLQDLDQSIFTLDEIAESLKLDAETVRRLFIHQPGVIVICFPRPGKRTYRTLRIPERALSCVVERLTSHDAPGLRTLAVPGTVPSIDRAATTVMPASVHRSRSNYPRSAPY